MTHQKPKGVNFTSISKYDYSQSHTLYLNNVVRWCSGLLYNLIFHITQGDIWEPLPIHIPAVLFASGSWPTRRESTPGLRELVYSFWYFVCLYHTQFTAFGSKLCVFIHRRVTFPLTLTSEIRPVHPRPSAADFSDRWTTPELRKCHRKPLYSSQWGGG